MQLLTFIQIVLQLCVVWIDLQMYRFSLLLLLYHLKFTNTWKYFQKLQWKCGILSEIWLFS